tara:strand:+ start:221 stop:580 length:360 start_codon:yes stop_codon:yes gene_type:complete
MIKTHIASLINSVALISLGLWGYLGSTSPSQTALIPVIFGIVIIAMNGGVKSENKIISHVVVTLTLLILLGLVMPLKGAIIRGDTLAVVRVSIMLVTTIFSLVSFIQSFIQARKDREAS